MQFNEVYDYKLELIRGEPFYITSHHIIVAKSIENKHNEAVTSKGNYCIT